MSETQVIKHLNVGYSWGYSLEKESVVPVEGTRASAKTTEKISLSGYAETYKEALSQLGLTKKNIGMCGRA